MGLLNKSHLKKSLLIGGATAGATLANVGTTQVTEDKLKNKLEENKIQYISKPLSNAMYASTLYLLTR